MDTINNNAVASKTLVENRDLAYRLALSSLVLPFLYFCPTLPMQALIRSRGPFVLW